MAITSIEPLAFSIADAVRYSGLSRSRLYELIRTGELASFTVGGRRMIYRDAVIAFFAKLAKAA